MEFVIKYPTCLIQKVVGKNFAKTLICSGKKAEGINPPEIKIIEIESVNKTMIPVNP